MNTTRKWSTCYTDHPPVPPSDFAGFDPLLSENLAVLNVNAFFWSQCIIIPLYCEHDRGRQWFLNTFWAIDWLVEWIGKRKNRENRGKNDFHFTGGELISLIQLFELIQLITICLLMLTCLTWVVTNYVWKKRSVWLRKKTPVYLIDNSAKDFKFWLVLFRIYWRENLSTSMIIN